MSIEQRREDIIGSVSDSYRPWLHLLGTAGSGVAVLVVALFAIEGLHWTELLVVPAMFILSNAGEWYAHKYLLHRRIRPFAILYDQHTPKHHMAYQYDTMAVDSYRELKLVLIPAFGVGAITVGISPIAAGAGLLLTANCGWLVLLSSALYVVGYELTHLAYHLPKGHPVGDWRVIAWLREHHRRHHDPRLMQKWNFNVTVPLWDIVMGTRISDEELAELTAHTPPGLRPARPEALSKPHEA